MGFEVGSVLEGKVTGITKFGAFVSLPGNRSGLVHISEIAYSYVNDVHEHLTEGQTVKVKVLAIGDNGKISLSIKKAVDNPPPQHRDNGGRRPYNGGRGNDRRPAQQDKTPMTPEAAFEDMMNRFKQSSEERMSDIKKNVDNKRRSQSRRK